MNTPFVRWLLDLEVLPTDGGPISLAWERPWPAWIWVVLIAIVGWLAIWSYGRLAGRRSIRGGLAVVRTIILTLLLVIVAGPMLELERETIERDRVLVLADRSASLTISDAPNRQSRDEQLRSALVRSADTWSEVAEQHEVHWIGFDLGAYPVDGPDALPAPDGGRTRISSSIRQALQRSAARPINCIVVLSDGRTAEPPDRALINRLRADAIPVYVMPLGSPDPVSDLALGRIAAPRRAFVQDKVPVTVEVERFGAAAASGSATVALIDETTGETLDEQPLAGDVEELTLTAEPDLVGETTWSVVLRTDDNDLLPDNNRVQVDIELVDRPLQVLFIDGYPRWEYRYVKNLLVREKSIDSSVMLLSADRDFAQEGNAPITRLPNSPEELARYDVIVLGDVPAGFFSTDQLDLIRSHVADRGAGLLWIAGERDQPSSYTGTVMADLLPVRGSMSAAPFDGAVTLQPTALAERLGVLQVVDPRGGAGWPEELSDPATGWSRLWWALRIDPDRLKPTAEVLAQTADLVDGVAHPLVVNMRYGAGQSIFVATDEIWRWRYGRGEYYPDQFWIQMIRMLGRQSLATAGRRTVLEAAPRRVEVGQPVRVTLEILDQALVEARRGSVAAIIEDDQGERMTELELRRESDAADRFVATYLPETDGQFVVRIDDRTLPVETAGAPYEVVRSDDELRSPETDHELLERLALETGGGILAPDGSDLSQLTSLPNRSVRTPNPLRESIWDTPLVFILLLSLLTLEWVGRKALRLV